jgi:hypothetical protein
VSRSKSANGDTITGLLVACSAMSDVSIRVTKGDVLGALRSKWWVLLLSVGVATGLLFAQASQFSFEPARVETIQRLEGMESLSSLIALEIDAQAFAPLLSMNSEIARFNSETTNDERNSANNFDVKLMVTQVPGDYDVINREITERNTVYSYVSVGTGIFVLTCTEASERDCERAITVGVEEFESRRNAAIQQSIAAVADKIDARLTAVRSLIASSSDQTALLAQRQLEAALASQVAVLRQASSESAFEFTLIDTRIEPRAATVNSVTSSTYLLGGVLGLLIGALIILQFAVLRSRRTSPQN